MKMFLRHAHSKQRISHIFLSQEFAAVGWAVRLFSRQRREPRKNMGARKGEGERESQDNGNASGMSAVR